MATITDGTIFIILSQVGIYLTLYHNKVRLWRFVGCFLMILVGIASIMVEDTIPTFLFFGISTVIAVVQLFRDITDIAEAY